jgi:drug/metabolite transporter (DMT)-like permease
LSVPGLLAAWRRLPPNLRGALWMLLAAVMFSATGALVKTIGVRLDSFQIAFFRCVFGFAAVLPFLIGPRRPSLRTSRPVMHLFRAVLGVTAMFCGFYSVTHMPLADAVAISFTKPLFVVLFAVFLLGETVRLPRWLATAAGFVGVLIMVRPGAGGVDTVALVALFGALCVASVQTILKRLAETESAATILFYFGAGATLVSLVPALLVWREPTGQELLLLCLVGFLSASGQALTIRALRIGESSAVAPFDYARILFSGIFGYLFFAEVPAATSLIGVAVIVASTLYIAHRESRAARLAQAAAGPRDTTQMASPSASSAPMVSGLRSDRYQGGASPASTARRSTMKTPK